MVADTDAEPEQLVSEAYALVIGPTPLGTCADWKAWADDDKPPDSDDISLVVTAKATPSSMQNLKKALQDTWRQMKDIPLDKLVERRFDRLVGHGKFREIEQK